MLHPTEYGEWRGKREQSEGNEKVNNTGYKNSYVYTRWLMVGALCFYSLLTTDGTGLPPTAQPAEVSVYRRNNLISGGAA